MNHKAKAIELSGEQLGYGLAERRTKQLLRLVAVYPIHIVVAYAYMLACKDIVEATSNLGLE